MCPKFQTAISISHVLGRARAVSQRFDPCGPAHILRATSSPVMHSSRMTIATNTIQQTGPTSTVTTQAARVANSRMPMLDGIRALACLLVVVGHFSVNSDIYSNQTFISKFFGFANYGVILFFCLSSFLLSYLFTQEYDARGSNSISRFLLRRTLRIWPLYIIYIIILNVISHFDLLLPQTRDFLRLSNPLLFSYSANWIYAQSHFAWADTPPYIAILWSLSVEEQIYLAFPFIASVLLKSQRSRTYVFAIIGLSFLSRAIYMIFFNSKALMYYSTFSYVDIYLIAGIFGTLHSRQTFSELRDGNLNHRLVFIFLLALLLFSMRIFASHLIAPFNLITVISYPLLAIFSCLSIVWLLNARSSIVSIFLSLLPVRAFGVLSYSIYVWHVVILYCLHKYYGNSFVNKSAYLSIMYFILFFFLTMAVACASYGFIERPFLRVKERYSVSGSANFFSWRKYLIVSFCVAMSCFAMLKLTSDLVSKPYFNEAVTVCLCILVAGGIAATGVRWRRQTRRVAWMQKPTPKANSGA